MVALKGTVFDDKPRESMQYLIYIKQGQNLNEAGKLLKIWARTRTHFQLSKAGNYALVHFFLYDSTYNLFAAQVGALFSHFGCPRS